MDLILSKKEKDLANSGLWLANVFVLTISLVLAFYAVARQYNLF
ncbi:MAG: hypothetical protein PHC97_04130 [Patescibacteria group bacterium]|nr:hypothetical protein [Patescibacteria group bacterium]